MAEIEFLDSGDAPEPGRHHAAPARRRMPWRTSRIVPALQPALLAAAAGLAVLACFQHVYSVRDDSAYTPYTISVDGWGRSYGPPSGGGAAFGVVICVAAGLLLVAAAGRLVRRARITRLASACAIAGLAGLAAVTAAAALTAQSVFDNERALQRQVVGDAAEHEPGLVLTLRLGWLIWWGVIAVATAGAAFAVGHFTRPRDTAPDWVESQQPDDYLE